MVFFPQIYYPSLVIGRRRQWHPTPVFLPGKSHGRRSLVGCSPWGREKSDTTEWLHFHFSLSCIGEGNGNPLQHSCLENPRDGGAWWADVLFLHPWVGKFPWRRNWQPTPVFLPGKSHGHSSLAVYSPWGSQRVGHDLATKQQKQQHCFCFLLANILTNLKRSF